MQLYWILFNSYLCRAYGWWKSNKHISLSIQIGVLEDTRNRTLRGILHVQSWFKGYQARREFREMRRVVTNLQSCMFFRILFLIVYFTGSMLNWWDTGKIMVTAVVMGERTRKNFSSLLRQHRAAVIIQKQFKGRTGRKYYKDIYDASILLQSGT